MWSVRLIGRVSPAKRQEFLDSARAAGMDEGGPTIRVLVLSASLDDDLFCWLADGEAGADRGALLASPGFLALKGAIHVLGTLNDLSVLDERLKPPPGPTDPRRAVGPIGSVWGYGRSTWTTRLVVLVPPDRRRQFAAQVHASLGEEAPRKGRAWTFEGLDRPDLVCCMSDVDSFAELAALLESRAFRALSELARSQGTVESQLVFRSRSLAGEVP